MLAPCAKLRPIGQRVQLMRLAEHSSRINSVAFVSDGAGHIDSRPARNSLDIRSRSFDDASAIGAWRIGQRRLDRVVTRPHVRVVRIHAGCMNTDQNLLRPRLRIGNLFELQVLQDRQTHERGSPSRARC